LVVFHLSKQAVCKRGFAAPVSSNERDQLSFFDLDVYVFELEFGGLVVLLFLVFIKVPVKVAIFYCNRYHIFLVIVILVVV